MEAIPERIEPARTEVQQVDVNAPAESIPAQQPPLQTQPEHEQQHETAQKHIDAPNNEEFEDEDDEDDDDYDDDEEKDNSQKLVIDINEDEKDDEEDDDDDEEMEELEHDNVPSELTPPEKQDQPELKEKQTSSSTTDIPKTIPESIRKDVETIITLSDAEDENIAEEAIAKPGKVLKRKSVGATSTSINEEEHYRLKRRKINAEGAPKMPLTGYVRYMNDRREAVRKEHPSKNSIEVTKIIAEEWQSLMSNVKGEYLKAAEADKQRYLKELHTFLKSRPDILASELAKNKNRKNDNNAGATSAKPTAKEKPQLNDNGNTKSTIDIIKDKPVTKEQTTPSSVSTNNFEKPQTLDKNRRKRTPTPPYSNAISSTPATAPTVGPSTSASATVSATASASSASTITSTPGEIPIFTNEFLEHNKIYDMELRSLRKSKTDLEQQNFVLEKHVENMKSGVEKMISENNELQEKNRLLEIYLDKLKRKLAQALGALPLPTAPNGATVQNIDKYMQDLYKMSTSNSHGPATLNKAKDIIRKLDLQIQL